MVEDAPAQTRLPRRRTEPTDAEAIMAMMNKSIDIARLQFKRVRKDLDEFQSIAGSEASVRVFDGNVDSENMSGSREIRTALFADIHFLLISIHETEVLFASLKRLLPHDSELSNLHNKHRRMMRRCSEFRTHMEHVDGKETEDLGRPTKTTFNLRGKQIELGSDFEKDAEALFHDIVSVWAKISDRQRKIRELIMRGHPAA